jgi:hypothetical protein
MSRNRSRGAPQKNGQHFPLREIKGRAANRLLPFSRKRKGTLWRENMQENEQVSSSGESDVVASIMNIFSQDTGDQMENGTAETQNQDTSQMHTEQHSQHLSLQMRENEDIMEYIDRIFAPHPVE